MKAVKRRWIVRLDLEPKRTLGAREEHPRLEVLYFTDPDCSWCWASEPVIKKMKAEYAGQVRVVYRMGGLLETWENFFDSRNQIDRAEQVAPHWVEVAERSGMPIDERVWYEDPPSSTYPGCIAYKAAEAQDEAWAEAYLRRLREAVMTERRNISKESVLFDLAAAFDFDMTRFKADYRAKAKEAFFADLEEGRRRGVRGFPTMIVANEEGTEIALSGYRPYADYENAFRRLATSELQRMPLVPIADFVALHGHVATREVAVVYDLTHEEALAELETLVADGEVVKETKAGGEFWQPVLE